ncbi:hypothetical protein LINPERHAP1_LOCUS6408 [Linum perenne]
MTQLYLELQLFQNQRTSS